jgi:hypothetical protein
MKHLLDLLNYDWTQLGFHTWWYAMRLTVYEEPRISPETADIAQECRSVTAVTHDKREDGCEEHDRHRNKVQRHPRQVDRKDRREREGCNRRRVQKRVVGRLLRHVPAHERELYSTEIFHSVFHSSENRCSNTLVSSRPI